MLRHAQPRPVPAGLKAHGIGPRPAAVLAYLSGSRQVSQRGLEEVVADVFDAPPPVGTVARLQAQMSAAPAPRRKPRPPGGRAAPVKNVDETGWKSAGKLCWLWVAAAGTAVAFLIHAHRGWDALTALFGEEVQGWVCSDRWSAYGRLSPYCRQACWAQPKRDFQKLVDRGAAAPPGRGC